MFGKSGQDMDLAILILENNLGQDPKALWRKMVGHAQVQAMTQELVQVKHSILFFWLRFRYHTFLVNCVWGSWSRYESCNSNTGKQSRSRSKTIVEKNGGSCSGSSSDIRSCAGKTLTIVHCNHS